VQGLHHSVQILYANPRALAAGAGWHLASWVVGAAEVWMLLYLMGSPIDFYEALILESLGNAVRSSAFLVPGALGVQEGGYALLGTLFGLPPQLGLALSLAKRVRELLLGVPALLVWQGLEGRRIWNNRMNKNYTADQ
ncbi:MAG: lysylphosphatidylglycerol synthase domain-containing protein, partial [Burkholderiales bacterium]